MEKAKAYITNITQLIQQVEKTQAGPLEQAARLIAGSLQAGGMLYTFGTGHSHMLAEELFYRAGGLARVCPILDEGLMLHAGAAKSTELERLSGYAELLLASYPVKEGDVLLIASNSGRNAVPVEMALAGQARGLKILALTSLKHSRKEPARHPSGKRLFELADIVLDNCGSPGDAAIDFGRAGRVGATSTVMGALLLQALPCAVVEIMLKNGSEPEIYSSSNVGDGSQNQELLAKYTGKIKSL